MMCTWNTEVVMCLGFLVDWRLLRLACRCHMGVASDSGEYLRICLVVNAEKVVRNHAAIACASVESVGENRLAL